MVVCYEALGVSLLGGGSTCSNESFEDQNGEGFHVNSRPHRLSVSPLVPFRAKGIIFNVKSHHASMLLTLSLFSNGGFLQDRQWR